MRIEFFKIYVKFDNIKKILYDVVVEVRVIEFVK